MGDLFGFLGDLMSVLFDGIVGALVFLFVPREDYFTMMFDRVSGAFDAQFGGIRASLGFLSQRLSNITPAAGAREGLTIRFSEGIFSGTNIDLLNGMEGFMQLIRGVFTGFISISTAVFFCNRITKMLKA